MNCESESVTMPSANTPAVCVTVTVPPRISAWRADPRVPARYAATIVLPWPGGSAGPPAAPRGFPPHLRFAVAGGERVEHAKDGRGAERRQRTEQARVA